MIENTVKAFFIMYSVFSLSPKFSAIIFEITFGTPIEEIVNNKAYIWYPELYIAFPASPKPFLLAKYNLYNNPEYFYKYLWY